MATVTRRVCEFGDGLVLIEVDYDDSTLRLLALRARNDSNQDAYVRFTHDPTGRTADGVLPAGQTVERDLAPNNPNRRLVYRITERGWLTDVTAECRWPGG